MRILSVVLLMLYSSLATADEVDMSNPNQVIHSVSINTFSRINAEKEHLQKEPGYIQVVIEEELIPYFDYKYAAYKVMGSHLRKTSAEQRNDFVQAFRTYLVNAYGNILIKYDQQQIEILDNTHFMDKKIVSIPVRIRDQNEQLTQLAFKLRKNKKTGEWKVFDVIAEGISMLNTKQSEINDLIKKKGINHVIQLLEKKNSEFSS
ncbi:MlaC/ttg2D family ABC transporter substrate-binding protein [Psychromonas ossibalaenae]|uniref:MlaC/ttg2D family ABC transporter substrate-binding protein n=1 Tax=Psychromonas ossibalaenae TaxID=444922 RepID=UPI00036CD1AA|nr:ABC transporter substrate-binding protein [Psychromonas ossibalaenae]